jgi:hypothetical protein
MYSLGLGGYVWHHLLPFRDGDLGPLPTGISSPVKKTEMDKSPFNSPSPQDSPRLSSFTQHHRPVIAVHSGECHLWEAQLSPAQPRKGCRFLSTACPLVMQPVGGAKCHL